MPLIGQSVASLKSWKQLLHKNQNHNFWTTETTTEMHPHKPALLSKKQKVTDRAAGIPSPRRPPLSCFVCVAYNWHHWTSFSDPTHIEVVLSCNGKWPKSSQIERSWVEARRVETRQKCLVLCFLKQHYWLLRDSGHISEKEVGRMGHTSQASDSL